MPALVCPNCGYDSRGLPSARCPECGQSLPPVPAPVIPALRWRLCLAAGIVALTPAIGYVMTVLPGVPQWWGPLPLTVVIPYFFFEGPVRALTPLTIAAALLALPVALGRVRVPWWTGIPIALAIALAWWYLARGSQYGPEYQGIAYVVTCGLLQVFFSACLVVLWCLDGRRSYWLVAAWHFLAALWLASYAFPYYGELP